MLVEAIQKALVATQMDPDRFFFDWRGGVRRWASVTDPQYSHDGFTDFLALIPDFAAGAPSHIYWSDEAPCTMLIDEVEALWAPIAERDDWAPLHTKIAAIRRMGEAHAES